MWKIILSSFLIVNSLFWGLYPHTEKCAMGSFLGIERCPSFLVHLIIGIIFYIIAILIVHFNSFSIVFEFAFFDMRQFVVRSLLPSDRRVLLFL